MVVWYVFLYVLLEVTIFIRGNAKFVWGIELSPVEWWLYVGWFSSLVGLTSWWGLVENLGVWRATVFTMAISCTVGLGLKWYFYHAPSWRNLLAITLCWVALIISEDIFGIEESPSSEETK